MLENKLTRIKQVYDFIQKNPDHPFLNDKTAEVIQRIASIARCDFDNGEVTRLQVPTVQDHPQYWVTDTKSLQLNWNQVRNDTRTFLAAIGTPSQTTKETSNTRITPTSETTELAFTTMDENGPAPGPKIPNNGKGKESAQTLDTSSRTAQQSRATSLNPDVDKLATALDNLTAFLQTQLQHLGQGQPSAATVTEPSVKVNPPSWKLLDAGLLWPDADSDKANGQPLFHGSKGQIYYVDANLWVDRIREWADTAEKMTAVATQAHTLLRGEAFSWWQLQLSETDKQAVRGNYQRLLDRVKDRFGIRLDEAGDWLDKNPYTLADNQKDLSIRKWAMDVFRYAKEWGDRTDLQQLMRVWQGLHPRLQGMLDVPTQGTSKSDFLDTLHQK